jgi:hypothetical protein
MIIYKFYCFNRPECFSFTTPPGEFKTTCMNFVRTEFTPEQGCPPGIYFEDRYGQFSGTVHSYFVKIFDVKGTGLRFNVL